MKRPSVQLTTALLAVTLAALCHCKRSSENPGTTADAPPTTPADVSTSAGPDGTDALGDAGPDAASSHCFAGRGPDSMMGQDRKILATFDHDGNGRLDTDERAAARKFLQEEAAACPNRGPGGGPGGLPPGFPDGGFPNGPPPGFPPDGDFPRGPRGDGGFPMGPPPGGGFPGGPGGGMQRDPAKPGARVAPADVQSFPDAPLYDQGVLRTFFLQFEGDDWDAELSDFYGTDIDVPATLVVDGRTYAGVGVHYRGNSSYQLAGEGYKKSLRVELDFEQPDQQLYGYQKLNLLNSAEDPTFMRSVLYLEIARRHFPSPKANHVRVVINGEDWGVYVSVQAYDKAFVTEAFPGKYGTRWQVPARFDGGAGLTYLGDEPEAYEAVFERKNGSGKAEWRALAELCRTLNETAPEDLEGALAPLFDVEAALWWLALDNVVINGDGYWVRGSDYDLYRDGADRFHVVPHDCNETFRSAAGGPGMPRGASPGLELDPLAGADDPDKPMLSRLLAVPRLRELYLRRVRALAEEWLDWTVLGPYVERGQALIEDVVEGDTRKLYTMEAFRGEPKPAAADDGAATAAEPMMQPELGLREFAEQRREFLLAHPALALDR